MPTCIHYFRGIEIDEAELNGTAEIQYSRSDSRFTILDVTLEPHCGLPDDDDFTNEQIVQALEQQDRPMIEQTIMADIEERDNERRANRGRGMAA